MVISPLLGDLAYMGAGGNMKRRFIFSSLYVVLSIAGCAMDQDLTTYSGDYTVDCPKPNADIDYVRFGSTLADVRSWKVDYVDVFYVVIADLVRSPPYVGSKKFALFLTVFWKDPSEKLLGKVSTLKHVILPGSMRSPERITVYDESAAAPPTTDITILIRAAEIAGKNSFFVIADYDCGGLCSMEMGYTICFDGEKFEIIERDLLTIG